MTPLSTQNSMNHQEIHEAIMALLPRAASFAQAPISHFSVGAVVRGVSGKLYEGANMEFPREPLSSTVHAEQCALLHAWHKGERAITHLGVTAPPCGLCRQFLMELPDAPSLIILVKGAPPQQLGDLLPHNFGPSDLAIPQRFLEPGKFSLDGTKLPLEDPLVHAAFQGACKSYAPYSKAYAGVALEFEDHHIITGRYGENAAFNPSLTPWASALSLMALEKRNKEQILRAALVASENAPVDHLSQGIRLLPCPTTKILSFFVPS